VNKLLSFIAFSILLLVPAGIPQSSAHPDGSAINPIHLEDLGILQVAAHDFFDVDRTTPANIDFENGLLDLSTVLRDMRNGGVPFSDGQIEMGGEPRNSENVMIFTSASELGIEYVNKKNEPGVTPEQARQHVLGIYYDKLEIAYMNAVGEPFPSKGFGCVTMTENLALRTIHDFLPDHIDLDLDGPGPDGPTNISIFAIPFGTVLSDTELDAHSEPLDGEFDTDFAKPTLIPALGIFVDLLARDKSFADDLKTGISFQFFLDELKDGVYNENDKVMIEIRNLFAKGLGTGCIIGGELIPIESTTLLLVGAQSTTWLIPIVVSGIGIGLFAFSRKPE
jgi:hypothetical protein